ncbi:hypothetical protein BC938DRAFT_481253 [Jimgerdemannia flammicorona]|uniref:FAS1 domain-containing protein n=1 Tax=Jimgerdemannia flammicorona TaxID=994334 RepID=A0A433QGL0_9FUNG|nr:hypothetical protein BC938DRAFT_481253 [Jimgerdemannia flammicorona]
MRSFPANPLLCTLLFALAYAQTITDTLESNPRFKTLTQYLDLLPKLRHMLKDESRTFTLFAPTNEAFVRATADLSTQTTLLSQSTPTLRIPPQRPRPPHPRRPRNLRCSRRPRPAPCRRARVAISDITACNGVVHGVDAVLAPTSLVYDACSVLKMVRRCWNQNKYDCVFKCCREVNLNIY